MEKGLGRQMNLLKFANVCVTILLASLATTHYASANEPVSPEARRLTPAAFVQLLVERNLEIQYARESSEVSRYLSLSEDALYAVPKALKEASFGMGATKFQTAFKVMIPAASSGIIVSIIH